MERNTGIKRILLATGYSAKGLRSAFVHEAAFRQEVFLALVLIPVACVLDIDSLERILMVVSLALVLIVELLNSAVEAVVDRFGGEHHELSGRAKDIGSAAVFVSLLLLVYTWASILWPRLCP